MIFIAGRKIKINQQNKDVLIICKSAMACHFNKLGRPCIFKELYGIECPHAHQIISQQINIKKAIKIINNKVKYNNKEKREIKI